MKKKTKMVGIILNVFLISVIFAIATLCFGFFLVYNSQKLDKNAIIAQKAEIEVFDNKNRLVENEKLYRYILYRDISVHIINAFVALEDKRFFEHNGIDYYRTTGALIKNIQAGQIKQGGSTITQQLAKNTHLSGEKTIVRKIKEMKLATEIEKNYSKEEILELYLNAIYYGNGIYGIDSACRNYFDKTPAEITPAEGAILAGIVKNPSRYSPTIDKKLSNERKNLVLRLMYEQGYLSDKEYQTAQEYEYSAPTLQTQPVDSYYNCVLQESANLLGITEKELICSPYRIYTYLDQKLQKDISALYTSKEFENINKKGEVTPYITLIADNKSGGVCSFSSNFSTNVFTFRRSPASTIKPILVYSSGLESHYITSMSPLEDKKQSYNGYSPQNFGDVYKGWISVEDALKYSTNTVAVQLLKELGIHYCKSIATKMGIRFDQSDNHLALALGGMTYGVTLPEITSSYMTLACLGNHKNVSFVSKITSSDGTVLYSAHQNEKKAVSEETAYILTDILQKCATIGTAKQLKGLPFDIASKTGTTESIYGGNSDAWNISYTPSHTVSVWYGDTVGSSDTDLSFTGGGLPTLLASYIHRNLLHPSITKFEMPSTVIPCQIDMYAWEKDKKVVLSNPYTPSLYKKEALFPIADCPVLTSTYFDIQNILFEVDAVNQQITVQSDSPFRYKLIERDLLSGNVTETEIQEGTTNLPIPTCEKIRSYYLAVYCEDEFLGYTGNKILFT